MRLIPLLFVASVAWAQVTISPSFDSSRPVSIGVSPANRAFNAITGLPYSGDRTSERVLSDNTHMAQTLVREFRDSSGRVREEHSGEGFGPLTVVEILDPIAGLDWVLDAENQVAYRLGLKSTTRPGTKTLRPCRPASEPVTGTTQNGMVSTSQQLGPDTIQGIGACGFRTTLTRKDGTPEMISEIWTSREDVGGILLNKITRQLQGGYTTWQLVNLKFNEPDPNLFLPPANYKVVEQKTAFSVDGPASAVKISRAEAPAQAKHSFMALTGMPFSADVANDGTVLTREYRDSSGRRRRESAYTANGSVTIADPVAGYSYTLDPASKTAHRQKINVESKPATQATFRPQIDSTPRKLSNGATGVTESLGEKTIDGIVVVGTRTTLTYPPGTMGGNDKTTSTMNEAWMSPQLGVTVMMQSAGALVPNSTTTLTNIKYSEPDAALFVVPPDYKIIGED